MQTKSVRLKGQEMVARRFAEQRASGVSSFILRPAAHCYSCHSIHSLAPFNCSLYQLQVNLGQLAIGRFDAFHRGELGNKGGREAGFQKDRDTSGKDRTANKSRNSAGKREPQNRIPFGSPRRLYAYKQAPFLNYTLANHSSLCKLL